MLERLQKIIARAGIASRRHAEELILAGAVTVNGKVVTALGTKADASRDHIRVGSRLLRPQEIERHRYFMLHKPPQVVATMSDPEHRPSLRGYFQHIAGRIFPVGRLEFSGAGLLLLTSDGDLASRLLRAARRLPQTYWLKLDGPLTPESKRRVEEFAEAQMRLVRSAENPWYEARFSGASRDRLRRALAEENLHVEKFMRTGFAGLDLGDLAPGACRPLTPQEIHQLERAAGSVPPIARGDRAAAALRAAMNAHDAGRAPSGKNLRRRRGKHPRPDSALRAAAAAARLTPSARTSPSEGPAAE